MVWSSYLRTPHCARHERLATKDERSRDGHIPSNLSKCVRTVLFSKKQSRGFFQCVLVCRVSKLGLGLWVTPECVEQLTVLVTLKNYVGGQ